jgi:hypothetical protein
VGRRHALRAGVGTAGDEGGEGERGDSPTEAGAVRSCADTGTF